MKKNVRVSVVMGDHSAGAHLCSHAPDHRAGPFAVPLGPVLPRLLSF